MRYLIVFRSMTQAQRAAAILMHHHISVTITRPSLAAGKGSCSAALEIAETDLSAAKNWIEKTTLRPLAFYQIARDGTLREVFS